MNGLQRTTDYTTVDDYRESIRSELEKKRKGICAGGS